MESRCRPTLSSRPCLEMVAQGCTGSPAFCAAVPLADSSRRVRTRHIAAGLVPRPSPAKRRHRVACALPWVRAVPAPATPVPFTLVPAPVSPPPPVETVPFWRRLLSALRGAHPAYFIAAAVFLLSYAAWTVSMRRKNEQIRRLEEAAAASARRPMAVFDKDLEEESGDSVLWLNLSLFPSVSAASFFSCRAGRSLRKGMVAYTRPCPFSV